MGGGAVHMSSDDVFRRFCNRFGINRGSTVTVEDLAKAEGAIGSPLPDSQKRFLSVCGAVDCPMLLDVTVKMESYMPALQTVLLPAEIPGALDEIRPLNPAAELIPFASDPSGNYFALSLNDPQVYFVDHDLEHCSVVAGTLEQLLEIFLKG